MPELAVLYIIHEFPARTQTFVEREIASLVDLGLVVFPISIHDRRSERPALSASRISSWAKGVAYPVVMWRLLCSLRAVARIMLLPPTGVKGASRQVFALAQALRVSRLAYAARLSGYTVHLHCHFMGRTLDVLSIAAVLDGEASTSATAHAADASNPASRKRLTVLANRLDHRIAASQNVAADLLRTSGSIADAVVHCGVPVPEQAAATILEGPRLRILTVGRLVEKKGVDVCLEAASQLAGRGLDFEWLVVGEGPLRADLERRARDLIRDGRVRFLGFRENGEVLRMLSNEVDVVVLASKPAADGDADGIPVVLMEAMSHGIPVVSTRIGGIAELVQDDSGWLVAPNESGQIAGAIESIVTDPDASRLRGIRGRAVVSEQFSNQEEALKLADLFTAWASDRQ